jgi:hypothetical protein
LEKVYDELLLRRRARSPQQGPAWMKDPQGLLRASCAADAFATVIPRIRKRTVSPAKGIGQLLEMLNKQSIVDIAKGVAMLTGTSFKTESAGAPAKQ